MGGNDVCGWPCGGGVEVGVRVGGGHGFLFLYLYLLVMGEFM